MKAWKRRGAIVAGGLVVVSIAAALVLNALNSNIALYVTPSEVAAGKTPKGQAFRIGGMGICLEIGRQAVGGLAGNCHGP